MPRGPAHHRQRGKNRVLFLILFAMAALLYALTIFKIKGA